MQQKFMYCIKKYLLGLFFCCSLNISNVNAQNFQAIENFRHFGDVFMLLPLYVGVISIGIKDYEGLAQLAIASGVTQGVIEATKRSFELSNTLGHPVGFSFRPNGTGDPKGMPSGHSGGAFSGAAFVFYRYGWKASIVPIAIASTVAASRVVSKRHTIAQVIVGGAIAWGFGYLFTSKYNQILITPIIDSDIVGHQSMGINFSKRF